MVLYAKLIIWRSMFSVTIGSLTERERKYSVDRDELRHSLRQIRSYAVVGLIAFGIDYAVMLMLVESFGVSEIFAVTISFVISIIANYFMSMRFVFTCRDDRTKKKDFGLFAGLSAVALIINDIAMAALTGFVFIDYRIAKPIATFVATIWNFISRKKFIDADKTLMLKKN